MAFTIQMTIVPPTAGQKPSMSKPETSQAVSASISRFTKNSAMPSVRTISGSDSSVTIGFQPVHHAEDGARDHDLPGVVERDAVDQSVRDEQGRDVARPGRGAAGSPRRVPFPHPRDLGGVALLDARRLLQDLPQVGAGMTTAPARSA